MTDSSQALLARASALRQAGQVDAAISAYRQLLAVRPEYADGWYNLGVLLRQARDFEGALSAYGTALANGISAAEEVHLNRGVILADHLARPDAAEAEYRAALALAPTYVPALLNLGNLQEDRGDRGAARTCYATAVAADPDNALAIVRHATLADPDSLDDPAISALRRLASDDVRPAADRADAGFALGALLDRLGDYPDAFDAYRAANAASASRIAGPAYDRAAAEAFVDRSIAAFSQAERSDAQERAPLFICGLFRSGSTLIEQILAAHPAVTAGGELDLLPAIASTIGPYPELAATADAATINRWRELYTDGLTRIDPGQGLVTDKRPDNVLHLGLAKRLFPGARILHTRRDPRDNVLALYFLHLNPVMGYALDLDDAAHWVRQEQRLMTHWRALYPADIFDVDYDALVREPRETIAALLEFCELDWDESVLAFERAETLVKTASVWQVRQPLYRHSSGRWRNYASNLPESVLSLG